MAERLRAKLRALTWFTFGVLALVMTGWRLWQTDPDALLWFAAFCVFINEMNVAEIEIGD